MKKDRVWFVGLFVYCVCFGLSRAEVVHTGELTLYNQDASATTSKTWVIADLNSTNQLVVSSNGVSTGSLTARGSLRVNDSFSVTVEPATNWSSAAAQAAVSNNSFGSYLSGLFGGSVDGNKRAELGVFSGNNLPKDSTNMNSTNEVLVFTVDVDNLTSGTLYLTGMILEHFQRYDYADFLVYDSSENYVLDQRWDFNSNQDILGSFPMETGDKFIVATGSKNATNEQFRIGHWMFDVLAHATTDGYGQWVDAYGGVELIGLPMDDYDGDGQDNLFEYATGGDPTNTLDSGVVSDRYFSSGAVWYIHPQRSDDTNLVYAVETCTNLTDGIWTTGRFEPIGTNIISSQLNLVTNRMPSAGLSQAFIRLRVDR